MERKILYVDMDGVIANFHKAIEVLDPHLNIHDGANYEARSARVEELCKANCEIFHGLEPIEGSIDAVHKLMEHFDVLFLSTPMWILPESYIGKRIWLEKHFGEKAMDRLILSKRKELNHGDYLIDDTLRNGVLGFKGEHIHFGTDKFPTWESVTEYLLTINNINKIYNETN